MNWTNETELVWGVFKDLRLQEEPLSFELRAAVWKYYETS